MNLPGLGLNLGKLSPVSIIALVASVSLFGGLAINYEPLWSTGGIIVTLIILLGLRNK